MAVCGVICEYNPFHSGHALHLNRVRSVLPGALIVCAMSGQFTQRGEPALLDKWTRARMALACGADAVFELPTLHAVRSAEEFARGGVALLTSLGSVTHIAFGSEVTDLALLGRIADLWVHETDEYRAHLRSALSRGLPHARARTVAAIAALSGEDSSALERALSSPNSILSISYLAALRTLESPLIPVLVPRVGAHIGAEEPPKVAAQTSGAHTGKPTQGAHLATLGQIESASRIRAALRSGQNADIALPEPARAILADALTHTRPVGWEILADVALAALRRSSPEQLARLPDLSEGLENRLHRAAAQPTLAEALSAAKSKRYPYTRIQRSAVHALLGITRELCTAYPAPPYARLLGLRQSARPFLAALRESAQIPIITKPAAYLSAHPGDPVFALDIRATDLWSLGCSDPELRRGHRDLTTSPVRVDE